jgi:hypothetical protein
MNYAWFSGGSDLFYYYAAYVEDTFFYVQGPIDYKPQMEELIKRMGY